MSEMRQMKTVDCEVKRVKGRLRCELNVNKCVNFKDDANVLTLKMTRCCVNCRGSCHRIFPVVIDFSNSIESMHEGHFTLFPGLVLIFVPTG